MCTAITELPPATVIAGLKFDHASAAGPPGASVVAAVRARAPAADRASSLGLRLETRRRATATGHAIRSFIYAPERLEIIVAPVTRRPRRRVCPCDMGAPSAADRRLRPFAAGSQIHAVPAQRA